jgi:hypothetical protein
MGRLDKLKREMIAEANRRLLNETEPLNNDESQTYETTSTIDEEGNVDVNPIL